MVALGASLVSHNQSRGLLELIFKYCCSDSISSVFQPDNYHFVISTSDSLHFYSNQYKFFMYRPLSLFGNYCFNAENISQEASLWVLRESALQKLGAKAMNDDFRLELELFHELSGIVGKEVPIFLCGKPSTLSEVVCKQVMEKGVYTYMADLEWNEKGEVLRVCFDKVVLTQ